MSEWWTYRLSDFLLFSPRAYWRLFELHNEALWPLPLLMLAAGLAAGAHALVQPKQAARWVSLLLAALWAWVAWSFFWSLYATINWAAQYVAPVFGLQALLLLASGATRATDAPAPGLTRAIAVALIGLALLYPVLAPLTGRPWTQAEFFGIAPDPSAIGTLALLLLVQVRLRLLLFPIPILWCLASGATLWAMESPLAWLPPAAALAGALALVAGRRSAL